MKKFITYTSILALFLMIGAESYAQYCSPMASRAWTSMDQLQTSGAVKNVSLGGLFGTYTDLTASSEMLVRPSSQVQMTLTARYDVVGTSYYPRVWIDMNDDNNFSSNELIYNGPRVSLNTNNLIVQFSVPMPPASQLSGPGAKRMRVNMFTSSSTNPCISTTGGSGVDFMVLFPPDYTTTVSEVISPRNPVCPGTLVQDLIIEVCNDGLERVDSVLLGGILKTTAANGLPLPPISMPNVWRVDSMLPSACKQFKVYTHAPGFKTNDTILVWSSMPNGVPDSMNINDTITIVISRTLPLNKKWSVGDTVNGANDFLTLNNALDSFAIIGGICDSLVIEIDTSHNGRVSQYDFPLIYGSSPTSPIILRPKHPAFGRVKLTFDSCDVDNNYILRLDDVSYMFIEGIDFYSQNGFTTDNSRNISMENGSHNIQIINCGFKADYANSNRNNTLIQCNNSGDNISIIESDFVGGADGVSIEGGSSHNVSDCNFSGTYLSSIHFKGSSNIEIVSNEMSSLATNIYAGGASDQIGMGIYIDGTTDDLIIENNIVKSSNSQWPRYGVFITDYNKASGTNWIYNNFLNIGQPWSSLEFRGITIENTNFTQIANNNIVINGNSGNNEGVFYNQGTGNAMWNNIVSVEVAGVAVRQASFGHLTKSDYNNFYAPGNNIVSNGGTGGGDYTTIAAYQNATSFDANSKQLNPFFYDTKRNDLHVCNNALSKAGIAIPAISEDFDGDPRSAATPSIGADEFTPISDVKLTADYGLCPGDVTVLTAGRGNFGETAIWKDLATGTNIDTNQAINISTPGEYSVTFFNACGVVVDTIEIITPDAVSLPNDTNMCFGTTLNVDATIVGGTTYNWSSTDSTAVVAFTKQATYSVIATDNWGCISSDTFDITYSPAADFGMDSIIVCEGASKSVLSNVDGTIGASFSWDGYNGSSTNQDPGATVSDFELPSKRAYVKVTVDHKGCISQDSILMKILGRPVVTITDTVNGLLFKVTSNTSAGSTHSWDFGDGDSSNFRLPKHIYKTDGVYTVTYTNSNQCRSTSESFEVTVITLNILENTSGATLTLYPNPNNGVFNLDFKGLNTNDISVSIMDINGRTVYNEAYGILSGNSNKAINLVDVATGFYTISVEVDGETYQEKFIVK